MKCRAACFVLLDSYAAMYKHHEIVQLLRLLKESLWNDKEDDPRRVQQNEYLILPELEEVRPRNKYVAIFAFESYAFIIPRQLSRSM
ncbi:hypothetical protein GCM10010981_04770 [Dyella nitratireducens]|uniref:Uncharacterized protein n=1 Tax=Dyella nitratireducens TaxID=1849580 RepID=A0ABQ1FKA9_9GAMM|nr:hypothetical protein GCM10010981_04770 [Dyella nitratireducens]GLQ44461.1 hypothetical protein GCM10007902_43110 [Dyella nitratireducens]